MSESNRSTPNAPKRPVARHACLACREKKIKCDGEIAPQPGEKAGEVKHQRCSNCKLLNIECVFVRSLRGGRRKKPQDGKSTESSTPGGSTPSGIPKAPSSTSQKPTSINLQNLQSLQNGGFLSQSPAGSIAYSIASKSSTGKSLDPPANIMSNVSSPYFNNGNMSPLVTPGSESSANTSSTLQEKVRALQREAASIQSQLCGETPETPSGSSRGASDYYSLPPPRGENNQHQQHSYHPHHPPPPPPQGPHGFPPPPPLMHSHHFPPPPPPFAHNRDPNYREWEDSFHGSSLPPPPPPPHHHHHHHHAASPYDQHPHYPPPPGPHPPPPPGLQGESTLPPTHRSEYGSSRGSYPDDNDEFQRKRTFSSRGSKETQITTPGTSISSHNNSPGVLNAISVSDQELELFDLPNWKTTCILIDLYYRYIHPSRPFLQPKHRFVCHLNVRKDASLLHAMFSSSCRFASPQMIPNQNLRDSQHWYFLAEKFWDLLDLESSLQAMVLLSGSLGPGGYVQQAIEGSERLLRLMNFNKVLTTLQIDTDYESYAQVATKRQMLLREDLLRTIWGSWKLNVFLRINRGFPFNQISDQLLGFEPNLQFPSSDSAYNVNLSLFDTNDNISPNSLKYRTWKDIEEELRLASTNSAVYKSFNDADLVIMAIKTVEDIMNTICQGKLTLGEVVSCNSKIKLIQDITNSSLYQISHIKKKILILNVSKIFGLFILAVAKLVINVTQCASLLLIKPHETNSNTNPDDVFNSLYKLSVDDIFQACLNTNEIQLQHFIETFLSALEGVKMLELGEGKIPQNDNAAFPMDVVAGPLNFTPAGEINSLRSQENWWLDAIEEPGKVSSARVAYDERFPDVWCQYPVFSVVVVANSLTILASSIVLTKFISFKENRTDPTSTSGMKKVDFIVGNNQKNVTLELSESVYAIFVENFNVEILKEKLRLCSRYVQAHGRFWPYVETTANQLESIINYIDDVIARV